MKVGEFFYELGINAQPGKESVDGFIKSIMELKTVTVLTGFGLGAMEEFFRGSIISSSQAAIGFQKFTNQTNLSWQELQKWQIVARQANVSAETIAGGVFNLQMNLAALARGEGPIGAFQKLLVGPEGTAFDVIRAIKRQAGNMAPAQLTSLMSQIGLSPDWMNIIRLPDSEIAKMEKSAMGMSTGGEKDILDMVKAWNELWLAMNDVRIAIAELSASPLAAIFRSIADSLRNPTPGGSVGASLAGIPSMLNSALSGISNWAVPHPGLPTMYGKPMNWGGAPVTNNVHMTVNGDTSDKRFADDVVGKILDETEAQIPLNESTSLVGR